MIKAALQVELGLAYLERKIAEKKEKSTELSLKKPKGGYIDLNEDLDKEADDSCSKSSKKSTLQYSKFQKYRKDLLNKKLPQDIPCEEGQNQMPTDVKEQSQIVQPDHSSTGDLFSTQRLEKLLDKDHSTSILQSDVDECDLKDAFDLCSGSFAMSNSAPGKKAPEKRHHPNVLNTVISEEEDEPHVSPGINPTTPKTQLDTQQTVYVPSDEGIDDFGNEMMIDEDDEMDQNVQGSINFGDFKR